MPNPAHEFAIRSFDLLISLELRAMNIYYDMRPFGSTITRLSFVVEVGLSESAR
ncbi:hypothetical protein BDV09DRAFT_157918 [Aspergillus tetrazonus]